MEHPRSDESIARADAAHLAACRAQRELLAAILELDRGELWRSDGAHDTAHWMLMRYGMSWWKAHKWLAAAHALEQLPRIAGALERGELGIDKVVELTRFATPSIEAGLVSWAQGVSCGAIRRRAQLAERQSREDARDAEESRYLRSWYFDEGRRFALEAELPAAQGAIVAAAIEHVADQVPVMPDEDGPDASARRADALVALCTGGGVASAAGAASTADVPTAGATSSIGAAEVGLPTIVVHAPLEALTGHANGEIESGPVIGAETVRRLACSSRIQVLVEDEIRGAIRLGRTSREPSAAMLRQLRYRDRECQFPGCCSRRFTHAHHIVWWKEGGRTDLDNLVLVCTFHHRLVHELGWRIERQPDGLVAWFRPGSSVRYRAGPAPPTALAV